MTVTKTQNVPTPMVRLLAVAKEDFQEMVDSAQVWYPRIFFPFLSSFLFVFLFF